MNLNLNATVNLGIDEAHPGDPAVQGVAGEEQGEVRLRPWPGLVQRHELPAGAVNVIAHGGVDVHVQVNVNV